MAYLEYKETKQRGTVDFPIEYYFIDSRHPRYAMPYHWHEELEIIRVLEGRFAVTIGKRTYEAGDGDIFLVNSGFLHGGIPSDCIYECLVLDTSLISKHPAENEFLKGMDTQSILLMESYPAKCDDIHKLFGKLFFTMGNRNKGHQLTTLGTLYEILGVICDNGWYTQRPTNQISGHRHITLLKQVLRHMELHYTERITLLQLSRIAGMSPKYFCRFFYEMTKRTPIDYLNYYKVEQACHELAAGGSSITEIAMSCGFNDSSYFIKTFRKYKGITPRQYLKQGRSSPSTE